MTGLAGLKARMTGVLAEMRFTYGEMANKARKGKVRGVEGRREGRSQERRATIRSGNKEREGTKGGRQGRGRNKETRRRSGEGER